MSLLNLDVGLSKDYKPLIDTLIKTISTQLVVHILSQYLEGEPWDIFTPKWFKSVSLVLLGLSFYFLVVNKVIKINYDSNNKEGYYNFKLV